MLLAVDVIYDEQQDVQTVAAQEGNNNLSLFPYKINTKKILKDTIQEEFLKQIFIPEEHRKST